MSDFDDLVAQVKQNGSIEGSAITVINGLHDQLSKLIAQNQDSVPADQIRALRDQLSASAQPLAAAITANTVTPTATGSTTASSPVTATPSGEASSATSTPVSSTSQDATTPVTATSGATQAPTTPSAT